MYRPIRLAGSHIWVGAAVGADPDDASIMLLEAAMGQIPGLVRSPLSLSYRE